MTGVQTCALPILNVLRVAPPLIIGEAEVSAALEMLDRTCRRLRPSQVLVAAK